jgi:hypothetical protein
LQPIILGRRDRHVIRQKKIRRLLTGLYIAKTEEGSAVKRDTGLLGSAKVTRAGDVPSSHRRQGQPGREAMLAQERL